MNFLKKGVIEQDKILKSQLKKPVQNKVQNYGTVPFPAKAQARC
jgi:hypothetical protein